MKDDKQRIGKEQGSGIGEQGSGTREEGGRDSCSTSRIPPPGSDSPAPKKGVDTAVLDWLNAHGYDIVKRDERPNPVVTTFENPPEDLFEGFEYQGPADGNERILVQVSKADTEEGVLKVVGLRKEGWEIEKVFLDGQLVRMKMPADRLKKIREERESVYRTWLGRRKYGAPAEAVADGKSLGSPIEAQIVPSGEEFTTEQILEMSRTGVVPASAED